MNSTFSIWKPVNMHSTDIVHIAKKELQAKVGHAGTLDPFAEGVLVLCVGLDTKNISEIMLMKKEYFGRIKLGVETDTLDSTGDIYKTSEIPYLSEEKISNVLRGFLGEVKQRPPAFSALKLNGKRLYEYARSGIRIIKNPRAVTIYSIEFIDFNGFDMIDFCVTCSSGTYIRSLASDIARELGCFGHLHELKRMRIGKYNERNSFSIRDLVDGNIKF